MLQYCQLPDSGQTLAGPCNAFCSSSVHPDLDRLAHLRRQGSPLKGASTAAYYLRHNDLSIAKLACLVSERLRAARCGFLAGRAAKKSSTAGALQCLSIMPANNAPRKRDSLLNGVLHDNDGIVHRLVNSSFGSFNKPL